MLTRRSKGFLVFVIAFVLLAGNSILQAQQPSGYTETATVLRIVDGDTISVRLASNGRIRSVRLIGINTPESGESCYNDAKNAIAEMLPIGSEIQLVTDTSDEDRYRRLLRYVYLDEVFINAEMVQRGWAESVRYEPDTLHSGELDALEVIASGSNIGCWQYGSFDPTTLTSRWRANPGNNVNVRSCASANCAIVTSLAASAAIEVIGTENNWHAIRLENGSTGYIAAWLTTLEGPAAQTQTTQTGTCSVRGNNVNLRTGPGINYGVAGTLSNGTSLRVEGRNSASDWYVVRLNNRQAWVYSDVITTTGTCNNLRVVQAPAPPQQAPVVQSAPQSQPPAQSSPSFTCDCSKACGAMASCQEAYFQLNQCGCRQRDDDGDGVPCESLCSGG